MTRAPFSWGMLLSLLCFIVCTNSYDPGMDAFLQQDSVLNSSHVDPGPALDAPWLHKWWFDFHVFCLFPLGSWIVSLCLRCLRKYACAVTSLQSSRKTNARAKSRVTVAMAPDASSKTILGKKKKSMHPAAAIRQALQSIWLCMSAGHVGLSMSIYPKKPMDSHLGAAFTVVKGGVGICTGIENWFLSGIIWCMSFHCL